MNFRIGQIADACGGELVLQGKDREEQVANVVLDSRLIAENGVFAATPGQKVDGHKFIGEVFAKGASLVITEKTPKQVEAEHGISQDCWGSYLLVSDVFQALKDIAEAYRRTLSIPVIGITGSVGKTSTKEFIAAVLSEKYKVLKTEGNFNNEVGVPLTLLRIGEEHQAAVVEMGISDFGEMHRLSKMVRPDICVITNIGQCHLETLKTRDGILQAKSEIFDYMAEDGEVCLNGGDDKLCTLSEVKGRKPHFFGLGDNPKEEVYAEKIQSRGLWGSDAELVLCTEKEGGAAGVPASEKKNADPAFVSERFSVHVPLPGRHMVLNAAAAACVGRLLGLSAEEIRAGIGNAETVGGRAHLMQLPEYTLIDDCYNANPVSMKAAIDLLSMADTEKVAVLGDMFELGEDSDKLHRETGQYAVLAGVDRIYCVGEHSRHMYEGAKKEVSKQQRLLYFADREALVDALNADRENMIPKGCTVLLKASHGMQFTDIVRMLSCF